MQIDVQQGVTPNRNHYDLARLMNILDQRREEMNARLSEYENYHKYRDYSDTTLQDVLAPVRPVLLPNNYKYHLLSSEHDSRRIGRVLAAMAADGVEVCADDFDSNEHKQRGENFLGYAGLQIDPGNPLTGFKKVVHYRRGLDAMSTLRVLLHEWTHTILHIGTFESFALSQFEKEIHAETTAQALFLRLGLEPHAAGIDYLLYWVANSSEVLLKMDGEPIDLAMNRILMMFDMFGVNPDTENQDATVVK